MVNKIKEREKQHGYKVTLTFSNRYTTEEMMMMVALDYSE
jgi:hypothetical protein